MEMEDGIRAAVCFLANFLYDKIPRRKVDLFAEALANSLAETFLRGAEKSEFRVVIDNNLEDLNGSAKQVNLDPLEILEHLPEMTVIMKSGEVHCQIKPEDTLRSIYKREKGPCSNPQLFSRLILIEKTRGVEAPTFQLLFPNEQKLTAKAFSMTRFGSTKLKDEYTPWKQQRNSQKWMTH